MTVRSSASGRRRLYYFICASYDHRGRTVCANALPLPMAEAEDAILSKVSDYVLNPEVVEGAIVDALRELQPSRHAMLSKPSAPG